MSSSTAGPLAVTQAFLRATGLKDWAAMRLLVADDAVWNMPGTSLISGESRGADAVVARSQQLSNYGLNVAVERILYGMAGVAVSLHNTGRRGDAVLDEHLTNVVSVSNGKIAGIDTYVSDLEMLNSFFA
jgi:ketosteroid isomerase-like protein